MLGKLTRKRQTNSSLDFSGRQGLLLVVSRKTDGLSGKTIERVTDERVHDGHGSARDTGIGVNLFQHLVDVRSVRLNSSLSSLLISSFLGGFCGFGRGLGHFELLVGRRRVRVRRSHSRTMKKKIQNISNERLVCVLKTIV